MSSDEGRRPVRRALLSAWRKDGVANFARALHARGTVLVSTGGTAGTLRAAGLPVDEVAGLTEWPEMLDGRVKTLHPRVHGGLLFRRSDLRHVEEARRHGILPLDLLYVDLYPFEAVAAQPGAAREDVVEMIDIGGPAMVRSAAKNHEDVAVLTDPSDLAAVLTELEAGGTTLATRRRLAAKAFRRTAAYDAAISGWLGEEPFPERLVVSAALRQVTRYGENPHQAGALYVHEPPIPGTLAWARQLAGKELSYNNLLDASAAWELAQSFVEPAAVIVKHRNPCGAAVHEDSLPAAFAGALAGDPLSAFGGILSVNRRFGADLALELGREGRFLEVLVAPEVDPDAIRSLAAAVKWGRSLRVLETGAVRAQAARLEYRSISGGLLVQEPDSGVDPVGRVVSVREPTPEEWADLRFAWEVCRHVTSNAIVLARGRQVVGVGAGQMSRVDAVEIAARKAGDRARGSALASDAFFPFPDGILAAARQGVSAVIHPGGSVRDAEVLAAADGAGLAVVATGRRHFRH
jgi:phosphoribosylaminoimidazolecarboxamide formyltransferase/IMP cyclohydrolase